MNSNETCIMETLDDWCLEVEFSVMYCFCFLLFVVELCLLGRWLLYSSKV